MSTLRQAVRGTAWVAAGTYAKAPLNFVANILLMRLVAPEHFGLLAMALFFLTLGRKLFGFGLNHALVHKQTDLDRVVPSHLALNVVIGVLVALLAFAARPLIAALYDADTAQVLVVLALFAVIDTAGNTPRIRLEKELDFSALVKLDLANTLVSNLVGIVAGFAGAGVWALVAKQAVAWVIQTVGAWRLAPPMPGRTPRWDASLWLLRFGAPLWLGGLATLVSLQFDDFLVGTLDSAESLGYYSRAYALATMPTALVTHIVARVAFPLYARVQHDRARLSHAFTQVLRLIVTLTAPVAVLMALAAPEFVPIVFGETWLPLVSLIRWLLVYACLRPIYDDCGELFTAVGKPQIAARILTLQAVFVLVACPPLTWAFGAKGAAAAVGIALAAGVVRAYQMVPRTIDFSPAAVFGPAAIASAAGAAGVWAAVDLSGVSGPWPLLGLKAVVFALVFTTVFLIMEGSRVREDFRVLRGAMKG